MRNAVTRRPHKERSQPQTREKWGLLEKHKDYSLRAKDYNQKKAKLKILSQKSKERHPDEFAFGMLSAGSSAQGKHGARGNENSLSQDAVQLLKTQDAGYLRTTAARTRKEIQKVSQEVAMSTAVKRDAPSTTNKVIFDKHQPSSSIELDTGETPKISHTAIVDDAETEGVGTSRSKSKKQLKREAITLTKLKADRKRRKRLEDARKAKLEVLMQRQQQILAAADQLELQRAKMANSVGGVNRNGVKFKVRERKR